MPFPAYDSKGLRTLSHALADALSEVQLLMGRPFYPDEKRRVTERLIGKLSQSYDSGVRDLSALKQAALSGIGHSVATP